MSSRPKLTNSSLSMAHFATLQLTTERSEEPKLLPPKVLSLLSFQMDQTIAKGLSFHRIAPQLEKAQKLQASNMPSYPTKEPNKHHPKPFGSMEKQVESSSTHSKSFMQNVMFICSVSECILMYS